MEKKTAGDLERGMGTWQVFSFAAGAMISSGLFVLPAVIYPEAGPGIILSYVFASFLMIPAVISQAELSTAMPKAGGTYFFIRRSLGPLFGTFAGLANWFSISLKSAFALVGLGILISPLVNNLAGGSLPADFDTIKVIALLFTAAFTVLNLVSARESGTVQVALVLFLIAILLFYIGSGINRIQVGGFVPFVPRGWMPVFTATGMVFISYGGLTKAAAAAGEIRDPGRNLPRGMFSAFIVVSVLYVAAVFVTVGLLGGPGFGDSLAPLATAASRVTGNLGFGLLVVAAGAAFITTANAGVLSASRVPLAMARDGLVPGFLARVSEQQKTPWVSILLTAAFMAAVIVFLDLETLVKVASTMMLILFTLVCVSVVIMRESGIVSYRPHYRSPLYPFLQGAGAAIYVALILEMGTVPLIITGMFFAASLLWYLVYSRRGGRTEGDRAASALIGIVERVTSRELVPRGNRAASLTDELREILVQRDQIVEDRFDRIIKNARILDLEGPLSVHELFSSLASAFADRLGMDAGSIEQLLHQREKETTTAIHPGLAIPHVVIGGDNLFDIVVARIQKGVDFGSGPPLAQDQGPRDRTDVHIVFALAGSRDERTFHLQALMAIAQIVHDPEFSERWMRARGAEDLRNLILVTKRARQR